MKRENEILESYRSLQNNKATRAAKFESANNKELEDKKAFIKKYYKVTEARVRNELEHGKLLNEARDNALATALKAIYISALEADTLTDEALILAENMVDNYIKESGGAQKIFNNVKADTYLLAKLRRIVEDNAEATVEDIENPDPEKEIEDEEVPESEGNKAVDIDELQAALAKAGLEIVHSSDDKDEVEASKEEEDKPEETEAPDASVDEVEGDAADDLPKVDEEEKKSEEESEPVAEEEPKEEEKAEPSAEEEMNADLDMSDEKSEEESEPVADEKDAENEDTVQVEDDKDDSETDKEIKDIESGKDEEEPEPEVEDSEESDEEDDDLTFDDDDEDSDEEAIDIDGDGDPDVGDIDEPEPTVNTDPNKKMFEELEDEAEIKTAVELIRSRVADAEEAFIKRNAEDKKQIDELLGKISNNISAVNKISNEDDPKSKIAQEAVIMCKRKINELNEHKALTIYEKMTRNLTESILKDESKRTKFINESGFLDAELVTESSKVMYAFLETLNTLQLETVDGKYIQNVLNNMK